MKTAAFGKDVDKEMSTWIQSNSGGINLMKRQGDDDVLENKNVGSNNRSNFSFINNARESLRVNSQRLGSVFGMATITDNPMKSSTSEPKKRVTSGEFHLNYLGYDTVNDLPSSGRIVSDISQIRLDQDRPSDVIVDPFRSTFPSQRSAVTDTRTV
jgi:hypothetical protein